MIVSMRIQTDTVEWCKFGPRCPQGEWEHPGDVPEGETPMNSDNMSLLVVIHRPILMEFLKKHLCPEA